MRTVRGEFLRILGGAAAASEGDAAATRRALGWGLLYVGDQIAEVAKHLAPPEPEVREVEPERVLTDEERRGDLLVLLSRAVDAARALPLEPLDTNYAAVLATYGAQIRDALDERHG